MARVCVVRQYYYPLDIRVRREVESLLAAGHEVHVVCERKPGEQRVERLDSLTIVRLPMSHGRGGSFGYLWRYSLFLALATMAVAWLHLRHRFALVQVHSLPDTLVLAGVIPRLFGARLLLDLHEVMPEFFATKFHRPMTHPLLRAVVAAEQLSIRVADHVMTCTDQMRDAFVSRGAPAEKVTVVLNSADEEIFNVRGIAGRPANDRFAIICHGSIEERYGLDLVVRAVALLRDEIPGIRFLVYGEGAYREELQHLVDELDVGRHVSFSEGFVPMPDLLCALTSADVGVVAMRRDAFRDLTHCNKMYEYMTLGLPVVSSRTQSVNAYFGDDCVEFFVPGDAQDLARALRRLNDDPQRRAALVRHATEALDPYRWPRQREIYRNVVGDLLKRAA